MRYVVYGAGSIGGVIGARLAHAGREVLLICRGAQLAAIRERGLTLRTPRETFTVTPATAAHASEVRFADGDVVLMCMKSQDMVAALDELRAAADDRVAVVCTQNGVEGERMALRRFSRVYGMVERFPAMLQEPGVVLNYAKSGGGEVETGRYPQGVDHLVERMVMDLRASGFDAQAEPRIERWKHEKLIINVGSPFAGIFGPGAETARIRAALEAEAYACFQAAGIDVPTREEAAKIGRGPVYDFDTIPDAPPFASSLWQGIMRGQRTAETDYINGEIALLGALHGVLAPVNHALNQLANRCARDGVKPGTVTVAAFERWVGGGPPPLG